MIYLCTTCTFVHRGPLPPSWSTQLVRGVVALYCPSCKTERASVVAEVRGQMQLAAGGCQ